MTSKAQATKEKMNWTSPKLKIFVLKGKYCQLRILYPAKFSFRVEGDKEFSRKTKKVEFHHH